MELMLVVLKKYWDDRALLALDIYETIDEHFNIGVVVDDQYRSERCFIMTDLNWKGYI